MPAQQREQVLVLLPDHQDVSRGVRLRYCVRCVLPDTRPNLRFGADGVCEACRTHGLRKKVDWTARARDFKAVVASAKRRSSRWDCLIPVSGGKDSTWQVVTCLKAGLTPLAVTWKTPGRTELGRRNLENLVSLGVDHIDWQVNPKVEARFMWKAFERYGSTAVPMHMALFNIPLAVAVRYKIPLVVWGENSAVEYGGETAKKGHALDADWLKRYGVMHGTTVEDWISKDLPAKGLSSYFGPSPKDLAAAGVRAIFLGHYFRWDPEFTAHVARRHGFRARAEGARTGLYDYADLDDDFISIHHWLKWHKFGFTRTFDNLSLEIRNGRMTRTAAVAFLKRRGDETPAADIAKFCAFAGKSVSSFHAVAERFRNKKVWKKTNGRWTIPGFIVSDRKWS